MRLFRRTRDTKTPIVRREGSAAAEAASVVALVPPSRPSSPVAPISAVDALPVLGVPPSPPSYEGLEDSDVFVCSKPESMLPEDIEAAARAAREVTLFVHGWHNVEPGLLSWTFPSLRAALDSVQRMKNAIGWCVVSGTGWTDLEAARAGGAILVEQLT